MRRNKNLLIAVVASLCFVENYWKTKILTECSLEDPGNFANVFRSVSPSRFIAMPKDSLAYEIHLNEKPFEQMLSKYYSEPSHHPLTSDHDFALVNLLAKLRSTRCFLRKRRSRSRLARFNSISRV